MFIVLDCGHSKKTAGKRSPDSKFLEYEYNRILGKRIGQQLTQLGINWCFTYDTERDDDLSLTERADTANRMSKMYGARNVLMISLHYNAAGNGAEWINATGWEIYTTKGDTISDRYADVFLESAKKVLPQYKRKIRGHKEADFTVIKKTACPSVLIEYGFYTNEEEMKWLMSEEGLNACTKLTVDAIKQMKGIR